jgi:hypothetical protein
MVSAALEDRVADRMATRLARAHLQTYRDLLRGCLRDAGVADPDRLARPLLLLVVGATVVGAIDADRPRRTMPAATEFPGGHPGVLAAAKEHRDWLTGVWRQGLAEARIASRFALAERVLVLYQPPGEHR